MNLCCNTVTCTHAVWANDSNKCWLKKGPDIDKDYTNNYYCGFINTSK